MGPARNLILHLYDLFPSHGLLFFPCLLDYLVFPTHLIEDIYRRSSRHAVFFPWTPYHCTFSGDPFQAILAYRHPLSLSWNAIIP